MSRVWKSMLKESDSLSLKWWLDSSTSDLFDSYSLQVQNTPSTSLSPQVPDSAQRSRSCLSHSFPGLQFKDAYFQAPSIWDHTLYLLKMQSIHSSFIYILTILLLLTTLTHARPPRHHVPDSFPLPVSNVATNTTPAWPSTRNTTVQYNGVINFTACVPAYDPRMVRSSSSFLPPPPYLRE